MLYGRRSTSGSWWVVAAFGVLGVMCGCASRPAAAPPLSDHPLALPEVGPIATAMLYPLITQHTEVEYVADNHPPRLLRQTLESTGPNRWRAVLESLRVVYLRRADDGSILIEREDELNENVSVRYDPPLVMLPAQLTASQPTQGKARMTVTNLHDGAAKDHGWCAYRVELLGTQILETPTGPMEAIIVQTQRRIDLQLAEVRVTSEAAYVPNRGWVAEQIDRWTKPLRLFEVHHHEQLRLSLQPPVGR